MNYPQSSCPSSECPPYKEYNFVAESNNAYPCSIGVPSCKKSLNQEYCQSNTVIRQTIQPPLEGGKKHFSVPLNKGLPLDKKWYIPVQSDLSTQCKVSYAGLNPILYDAPRAQRLLLDQPHYTGEVAVGNVPHDKIYTKYYSNYGKNYSNYEDITGGDIQYWLPENGGDAYAEPVFTTPALVDHVIRVDPMGVVRPEYKRLSTKQYDWDQCNQDSCDSFTHDQLEFRQELMEKQMRKRNEQEYDYRWAKHKLGY
jgi:hypothetical protein